MNPDLTNYIRRYIDISDHENDLFQTYLKSKIVKKKAFLFKEGENCKARYFITKGCFRFFYLNKKANEQIVHFGIENCWITSDIHKVFSWVLPIK